MQSKANNLKMQTDWADGTQNHRVSRQGTLRHCIRKPIAPLCHDKRTWSSKIQCHSTQFGTHQNVKSRYRENTAQESTARCTGRMHQGANPPQNVAKLLTNNSTEPAEINLDGALPFFLRSPRWGGGAQEEERESVGRRKNQSLTAVR